MPKHYCFSNFGRKQPGILAMPCHGLPAYIQYLGDNVRGYAQLIRHCQESQHYTYDTCHKIGLFFCTTLVTRVTTLTY